MRITQILFFIIISLFVTGFGTNVSAEAKIYYVSTSGNNDNAGTEIAPLGTIGEAARRARSGDTIRVNAGRYYETVVLRQQDNITLEPTGNGDVEISGAIRELTQPNNGLWTYDDTWFSEYHKQDFRVWSYNIPQKYQQSDSNIIRAHTISDFSDNLMWTYGGSHLFKLHHAAANNGEGAYFTKDKVYLSLRDINDDPNQIALNVSTGFPVIHLNQSSNITIQDKGSSRFVLRDCGRYCLLISNGSTNNHINHIKTLNGHDGIWIANSNHNLISENQVLRNSSPLWTWSDVKFCLEYSNNASLGGCKFGRDGQLNSASVRGNNSMEARGIIATEVTKGNQIVKNQISGYFDGIDLRDDVSNTKVYGNIISNIMDDAIQIDDYSRNNEVFENEIYDSFVGISLSPARDGPTYIYSNTITANKRTNWAYDYTQNSYTTNDGHAFKIFGQGKAWSENVKIYFNTIYSNRDPVHTAIDKSTGNSVRNISFLNNIIVSESTLTYRTGLARDDVEYDSNLFFSLSQDNTENFANWNGNEDFNDLSQIIASNKMPSTWTNNVERDSRFMHEISLGKRSEYHLRSDSHAIASNGMVISSIDSEWPEAEQLNSRDSIGAIEWGGVINPEPTTAPDLEPTATPNLEPTATPGQEPTATPSSAPILSTPTNPPLSGNCGGLVQEAENGSLYGAFEIVDNAEASNGKYIQVPDGQISRTNQLDPAHRVDYCFDLPANGSYRVKARANAESGRMDTFYIQINGGPQNGYVWKVPEGSGFSEYVITDSSNSEPLELELSKGHNSITVFLREDGAKLDTISLELIEAQTTPQPTSVVPPSTPQVPTATPTPEATPTAVSTVTPTPTPTNTPVPDTISGELYIDSNGNGVKDSNEEPLAGVIVLLIDFGTDGQTLTLTTMSDTNGFYLFRNVSLGDYIISFALPPGYRTASGADQISISNTGGTAVIPPISVVDENIRMFLPLIEHSIP